LVPVEALSVIFRAKMCAALKRAGLLVQVSPKVWKKKWVVHCQHAGHGQQVLPYLARYVFRVAISNSRLERIEDGQVTFRYRHNLSQQMRRVTLSGAEFLRRFLQHVLPRGCAKVRYYGIWSPSCRHPLDRARALLPPPPAATSTQPADIPVPSAPASEPLPVRCPHCHQGNLILVEVLRPQRSRSP
jgi:hypothetical protein